MLTPGDVIASVLSHLPGVLDHIGGTDRPLEVLDTWERDSSGASFYRLSAKGVGAQFLVKTDPRWSPVDAENIHRTMADLDRILTDSGIHGVATIPSLGWAATPPMIVMPYIDADELITLIREGATVKRLSELLSTAGSVLAAYHRACLVDDQASRGRARSATVTLAGKLPGGSRKASALIDQLDPHRYALSYGDVTPGNFLSAGDGRLLLIDPPPDPKPALIHRDLGYFLVESNKHFAGRGRSPSAHQKGFETLRSAFLRGYAGTDSLGAADHALIALFEFRQATGIARNRWPRRPTDALWFASKAAGAAQRFLGNPRPRNNR